jgi:hypothetical protein
MSPFPGEVDANNPLAAAQANNAALLGATGVGNPSFPPHDHPPGVMSSTIDPSGLPAYVTNPGAFVPAPEPEDGMEPTLTLTPPINAPAQAATIDLGAAVDQLGLSEPHTHALEHQAVIYNVQGLNLGTEGTDGLVWKIACKTGTLALSPGPGQTDLERPLELTPDLFNDMVLSAQEQAFPYITVPETHANGALENTGYVRAYEVLGRDELLADQRLPEKHRPLVQADPAETRYLMAGIEFTEPHVKEKALRGSIPDSSIGVKFNYRNKRTGKLYRAAWEHLALTPMPWVDGLVPFGLSQGVVDADDVTVPYDGVYAFPMDLAITFDPQAHPRDWKGRFREIANALGDDESIKLPDGTTVTKKPGKRFEVNGKDVGGEDEAVKAVERKEAPGKHFDAEIDAGDIQLHMEQMNVGSVFTIADPDGPGDWSVKRYSADDFQYTPAEGRTRIGSMDEVLEELFPGDYVPSVGKRFANDVESWAVADWLNVMKDGDQFGIEAPEDEPGDDWVVTKTGDQKYTVDDHSGRPFQIGNDRELMETLGYDPDLVAEMLDEDNKKHNLRPPVEEELPEPEGGGIVNIVADWMDKDGMLSDEVMERLMFQEGRSPEAAESLVDAAHGEIERRHRQPPQPEITPEEDAASLEGIRKRDALDDMLAEDSGVDVSELTDEQVDSMLSEFMADEPVDITGDPYDPEDFTESKLQDEIDYMERLVDDASGARAESLRAKIKLFRKALTDRREGYGPGPGTRLSQEDGTPHLNASLPKRDDGGILHDMPKTVEEVLAQQQAQQEAADREIQALKSQLSLAQGTISSQGEQLHTENVNKRIVALQGEGVDPAVLIAAREIMLGDKSRAGSDEGLALSVSTLDEKGERGEATLSTPTEIVEHLLSVMPRDQARVGQMATLSVDLAQLHASQHSAKNPEEEAVAAVDAAERQRHPERFNEDGSRK